jgi:hypothetical protein
MVAELIRLTQNSGTTAPSGRGVYHLQFLLQAASPETFGYTILLFHIIKEFVWVETSVLSFWHLVLCLFFSRY